MPVAVAQEQKDRPKIEEGAFARPTRGRGRGLGPGRGRGEKWAPTRRKWARSPSALRLKFIDHTLPTHEENSAFYSSSFLGTFPYGPCLGFVAAVLCLLHLSCFISMLSLSNADPRRERVADVSVEVVAMVAVLILAQGIAWQNKGVMCYAMVACGLLASALFAIHLLVAIAAERSSDGYRYLPLPVVMVLLQTPLYVILAYGIYGFYQAILREQSEWALAITAREMEEGIKKYIFC